MPVYSSIYDGPPRSYGSNKTAKKWIVIHNTSNDAPAKNEASYAKNRTDGVSSHYYVDRDSIVQSLDTDLRANHVGSATGNNAGISYEITGTNAKTCSWWLENVAWGLLAKQIRLDCAEHGITPRLLTIEQIKAGDLTGIITHNQARQAWGGTDHTDPGANFPLDHLLAQVKGEDDMDLSDRVTVTEFATDKWGIGRLDVDTALGHTYVYSRNASDNSAAMLAEFKAARLREEAILAAVKGLNTEKVIAAVNAAAAADAQRDAAILAEVQELASGGATAQEVYDHLLAKLNAA